MQGGLYIFFLPTAINVEIKTETGKKFSTVANAVYILWMYLYLI